MAGDATFAKAICSICYEDLKPIVEDIQAISICGHVFHELCLQQWFEYCSNTKKCTCPVCKQLCSVTNANRLYFQSVGDSKDPVLTQKPIDYEEDPEELRSEVSRLVTKVTGLTSVLERQGKKLKEVDEELCSCKEQAKKEAALKYEALKQTTSMQQLLHLKSEDLDKSTLECLRLQERNMALAKELAAFKLVSDLDLDEEKVLKLASFGNGANNKDTIDILKKSLVMRNRSYKELMAKCNLLGRGEARFCRKLDKAKEKMNKLKTRVQELETALEVKENEVLRSLKASKKSISIGFNENDVNCNCNCNSNSWATKNFSSQGQEGQLSAPMLNSDERGGLTGKPLCSRKMENFSFANDMNVNYTKRSSSTMAVNREKDEFFLRDEDASKFNTAPLGLSNPEELTRENVTEQKPTLRSEVPSDMNKETTVWHGQDNMEENLGSRTSINNDMVKTPATLDEDVMLPLDDITQVEPKLNIRRESPSPLPLSEPGGICFSGGLLGPDGTHRFLGKWCKRSQTKGSLAKQGSSSGNLIAIGADGRGGKIKVLRSPSQSSLDGKENSVGAKRTKYGSKTSSLQSQGCLQIEHFFGRVGGDL